MKRQKIPIIKGKPAWQILRVPPLDTKCEGCNLTQRENEQRHEPDCLVAVQKKKGGYAIMCRECCETIRPKLARAIYAEQDAMSAFHQMVIEGKRTPPLFSPEAFFRNHL